MERQLLLGTEFTTGCNLNFRGFEIPKGTIFEINEILSDGDYKVCFTHDNQDDPECIQILTLEEIKNIAENFIMLVEYDSISNEQPIRTNLNYEQLQEIIAEYKNTTGFEKLNIEDIKKIIISEGYKCEIMDMPYVYY